MASGPVFRGNRPSTRSATSCWKFARSPGRTRFTGWGRPRSPTKPPTSTASSRLSGEPIIPIIRRVSAITPRSGVANTWGYGAMTNSYNDIRNAKTIMLMGGNPAEAHPVSLQHILEGKELNRANMIVVDPRMTRTAAHATEYVRVRPRTHIATLYGLRRHIFANGCDDKELIK